MNSLGITLIWLTVQVTILALVGLGLTYLAARHRPGAGASTALATLLATALLAMLAVCPLPSWWTWDMGPAGEAAPTSSNPAGNTDSPAQASLQAASPVSGGGFGLAGFIPTLRDLVRVSQGAALDGGASWNWPATAAAIALTGTSLGVLRLLLGILAIRRAWQNSRPVTDPALMQLAEHLRQTLGIKKQVDVREWADLHTAATVGWRKASLLLPRDWRDWTPEERRAVVAHELVHVARSDYAGTLFAHLSLVLHFWHPLVHLLVRQFQIQQELAADATAASVAGGSAGYLRALARLALQSDGRAHGWPAPALLSPKGTLLRRVEMLRFAERVSHRPISRTRRRLTLGLICGLTVAAAALRCPVPQSLAESAPDLAKPVPAQVAPFDLSLLDLDHDSDAVGAYGMRPAAIFHRPSTEPWCRDLNQFIDEFGKPLELGRFGLHVEDVEQVMGRVYVKAGNKPGKGAIMFSVNVLRMSRDVDWDNLRDQEGAKLKKHQWKGQTYVSVALPPAFLQFATGIRGDGYFWAPGARTLIFDTEDNIKRLIEAKTGHFKPARPGFAAGWERLSRGLLVIALDKNTPWRAKVALMTRTDIKESLKETEAGTAEYDLLFNALRFCKSASQVVVGCAGGDDFQVDLWASADTPARAGGITRSCEGALGAAKKLVLAEQASDPNSKTADMAFLHFIEKLLCHTSVRRDGNVVTVHAEVASGFDALLSLYARGGHKTD